MTIKRKDFQKAAALIHEFLLKLGFESECSELRDALNLALLHMQRYYRLLRTRMQNIDKTSGSILAQSLRGLSPMTPFKDAPDKFQWRWLNLDNPKVANHLPADVNKDVAKLTKLIQVAKDGKNERIMHLIDEDPESVFECDGLGRNALVYAVHFAHLDTIQILLENGIDVNATAHDGSTPAHRACHDGNHEALQILISYGANVSVADTQGRYPIHWACASKSRECLRLLIEQKVNVNVRDKEGMSPSMWACRMDHIDHFELLTQAEQVIEEEDGYERDTQGRTWIHWSVRRTEPLECLKTLLTEDSADWRDDEGKSVMHSCAEQGSLAAAKVVLEIAGSPVLDHRDNEDRTPLILAAIGGHGEVLNYLLSQGADHAGVDNFGASAWDYARAKQLHYCMLIVASYIRQRAKEEEKLEKGLEGLPGSDVNDLALSGMGSLQINGNSVNGENQLFYGNKPVAPPHPPSEPPTPRTPRSNITPRFNVPSRVQGGWETPQTTSRSPPPTARGQGQTAVKRMPSGSDSNGDNGNGRTYNRPSKRQSTGGKRRKNEHRSPERDSRMSVHSVSTSQEFGDARYNGEPEMNAESEYLNDSETDHAEQERSVSIAAMDVSDFEGGQEGDDERTIIEEDTLQPMESERMYRDRGGGGDGRNAINHSSNRQSAAPHPQPRHSPTSHAPMPPNRSASSPHSPPRQHAHSPHQAQTPYYSANREHAYDEDDDGEIVHTPSPPPRQNKPYSYQKPAAPPPSPPPHLQPLPPPSPGKKKKKKKKDRDVRSPQLAPVAGPVPPHRGYAAPMQPPPSSPHPSSASASSTHQHPNSPRGARERSPTSRNSSAVSSLSRHSGDPYGIQGGGAGGGGPHGGSGGYMAGGLVGNRPPSMKTSSKKQGFPNSEPDYRHTGQTHHAHLNPPATGNKPPVFPKAAPRSKSQKLHPLAAETQPLHHQSPHRGSHQQYDQHGRPRGSATHQGHHGGQGHGQQGQGHHRMGSGQQQMRLGGLPNGNVQNGFGDSQGPQHSRGYPQKHGGLGSGGKKRSQPADHPPASPRGGSKHAHSRGPPPPMSGKQMANGRLPPTY